MGELKYSDMNTSVVRRKRTPGGFTRGNILTWVTGFFVAMAMPYNGVAPFGMSYLTCERKISVRALVTLLAITAGSMAVCDRVTTVKYLAAGIIYLSVLFVLERNIELSDTAAGMVAGSAILLAGLIGLFWQGFTFPGFLLLVCESAAAVAGAVIFDRFSSFTATPDKSKQGMESEDKISLCVVGSILIMSLREIYLGTDFSVMNMAAATVLMTAAAGCGVGCSTGTGVILGLICGTGSEYFMPILGAYSFCGFLSGLMSRFGKGGVIAGVVLANGIMVVYTNGAMQTIISFYEILAASVIFGFVPRKWIEMVKESVTPECGEKESIARIKQGIRSRLASIALSFATMSDTLRRLSDPSTEANDGDIATVFDMAADKVCRNCRKCSVCWNESFDYTYDALFKMMEAMEGKGMIEISDAEEHFRAKCVNLPELITEINHRFDMQQMRRVWQSKFGQSRQLVGQQLAGVANILDGLSGEIGDDTCTRGISGTNLRSALNDRGIKVRDINIFQDGGGRHRVELTMRSGMWKEKTKETLKRVMRNIMDGEVNICDAMYNEGKMVRVEVTRAVRFKVETNCAMQAAAEVNGDNYRFSHIGGGKYVIALSDGMGTGSRASRESQAMLELLDSFLRAGFESRMAIKFINSVMCLKADEEAFATVDICIIDLYTGRAEFIKTGAEPSFILKETGVDTVQAASLPLGVLTEMETEICSRTVEDGDVIIMMTDGIECREGGSLLWVSDFISQKGREEGELKLADSILARAIDKNQDIRKDDMTVLSVRIRCA